MKIKAIKIEAIKLVKYVTMQFYNEIKISEKYILIYIYFY